MKTIYLLFSFILASNAFAQLDDSIYKQSSLVTSSKAEILNEGVLDISETGQMNASARLFRFYIGEPGKFKLPVSLYIGVSTKNLSVGSTNSDFAQMLINPTFGIINLSFDGKNNILKGNGNITKVMFQYHTGFRLLNAFDRTNTKTINFINIISCAGFTFLTGAWERNNLAKIGEFWFNFQCLYSNNLSKFLDSVFREVGNPKLLGYSGGIGIYIKQSINLRTYYFRFLNNQDLEAFNQSFFQLSFSYQVK